MAAVTIGGGWQDQAEEVLRTGSRFGPQDDQHELGDELGSGAAARVYTCTQLRSGERRAVKVINLNRLHLLGDFDGQMLKLNREVEILSELHHPRIVNLHTVHRTKTWVFLVMELVRGGELFDQIVRNRTLHEVEAKYVFRQLLDGVGYMHSRHVIHRDLKPENILIACSRPAQPPLVGQLHDVKIADFGLSKVINEGTSIAKTFVGTPQYWAPEVLNVQRAGGSYTQAADFWSLGAVLFVMLCGRYPFDGKKMPLEEQIQTASFNMTTAVWQKISEEAKDMVRGLLKVSPSERLSWDDCLRHPWLRNADTAFLPPNPSPGPLVTEVSCGQQAVERPPPMVTHPSNTSDVSVSSGVSVDTGACQDPQRKYGSRQQYPQKPQVPSIQVGDARVQGNAAEQETIFCLNELLKLQVSIAGSLEMACLAFRHADTELSDAIRRTFWQARDLFSHAANVVSQYAEVAQQVGQLVLSDLKLAVDEKEPSLAVSLLGMVKGWVANMKKDGEEIQGNYKKLQESVHQLIQRAQHTKTDADRRLAEAVQVAEAEMALSLSPRTQQQFLTLGPPPGGPVGADASLPQPRANCTVFGPAEPAAVKPLSTGTVASSSTANAVGVSSDSGAHTGTLNLPFSMNVWTRQLFEQLSMVQEGSGAKGGEDLSMFDTAGCSASGSCDADNEAWKRDVLELLFMAPGISTSQLPQVQQFASATSARGPNAAARGTAEEVQSPALRPKADSGEGDGNVPFCDETAAHRDGGGASSTFSRNFEEAVVRYIPTSTEKSATEENITEAVTHSSASLLRALRELKRVDEILHGCSAFWANMDGTVQKLAQMKEHTETLVNFAANSKALKQRFEQRLGEYTNFWVSLERVCRQYCMDHQAASKRMYEVIREVADAADVFDTAQSARMGMVLAMREKQRRHGSAMQY